MNASQNILKIGKYDASLKVVVSVVTLVNLTIGGFFVWLGRHDKNILLIAEKEKQEIQAQRNDTIFKNSVYLFIKQQTKSSQIQDSVDKVQTESLNSIVTVLGRTKDYLEKKAVTKEEWKELMNVFDGLKKNN